ncbi:MAG TPA: biotin/lipoyl-binding protein [Ramlibacter sp.]|nr:biotin/lipoyl-binding protein [Ramlibacter sp.]
MASSVFSDSWFRVASMRVSLLPTVRVQRQAFRGQDWYVLEDSYTGRFFRITPQAWAFVSRLTPDRTVEETWNAFLETHPQQAPGQEAVIQLLSQLHVSNLLYFRHQPDNDAIVDRVRRTRRRELAGKALSFLFFRVPLVDPNAWLDRISPFIRFVTGPWMALVWLVVVALGCAAAIENGQALLDKSQGLLSLSNLPWLYICLAVMKLLHELGHAFVTKRYGGEVRTLGVMFLLFTPLPYVDATASWAFRNSWHRVYVGAAGMLVEFFLAALGALLWAATGPGLVNSIAFNVMVIGSVSSLIFNGNPLLRFDAYYMLSDAVQIPNLYQKGQKQWLYFGDRYLLGTPNLQSPAEDRREWWWLTGYGLLSFVYLIIVTVGISLFLLDQWFVIGLVALGITLATKLVIPLWKLLTHLAGPKVARNRQRALAGAGAIAAVLVLVAGWVPFPYAIQAAGILQAEESTTVYTPIEGALVQVVVRNGQQVRAGDVVARLRNPDLDQDLAVARAAIREADAMIRAAMVKAPGQLPTLQEQRQAALRRIAELEAKREQLVIRSPRAGEWVAPALHESEGNWLQRGAVLGEAMQRSGFRFVAVVQQEQANELFAQRPQAASVKLTGQADVSIPAGGVQLIPYQQQKLLSPALGWLGGGEIAVKTDDRSGNTAAESFFALHVLLPPGLPQQLSPLHGMSGQVRLELPGQPLFWQARRSLMQLMQKRYSL